MKKNILAGLLILLAFSGYGQQLRTTDDSLDKAVLSVDLEGHEMASIEMKQELQLTQDQYRKVEQLNRQRYQRMKEAQIISRPEEVEQYFYEIKASTENELTGILSESQLQRYLKLEGRENEKYVSELGE